MCYRRQLWGAVLIALGAGFILSTIFSAVIVRVIIGIVFIAIGLTVAKQY